MFQGIAGQIRVGAHFHLFQDVAAVSAGGFPAESLLRMLNQDDAFLFQEAAERLGNGVAPVEDPLSLRADDDAGGGRVDPVLLDVVAEDLEY